MSQDLDHIWKALAEPTRRAVLDLLRDGPKTTGQIVERFPGLTRFAIMKHLNVLEDARLVIVERVGRERWNYLNTVPIREIYERWMGKYAEHWSSALLRLRDHVEHDQARREQPPAENKIDPIEPQMRRRRGA